MEFRELTLADKATFDRFFAEYPPQASELTFTNLFCWRNSRQHKFSISDNHLLVKYGNMNFYQPIGPDPAAIIEKVIKKYPFALFHRVEKPIAEALKLSYEVAADRNQWDYVYSVKNLVELPGQGYAAKRNFVKRALKLDPKTCPINDESLQGFLELQEEWCRLRQCSSDEHLSAEDEAAKTAIAHFAALKLHGICVSVNRKIEAFAIAEPLNNDTFVEHFEKANGSLPGLYQYVLNELCKSLPAQYLFINREQDLGVEGLRKAKESYHPVRMVEKYRISAK